MDTRELRSSVLESAGATASEVEELLLYNRNFFDHSLLPARQAYPLADEPFAAVWEGYARESAAGELFPYLKERLVQLRFPVQAGISQSEAYLAATRRGVPPPPGAGLELRHPERLRLEIHATAAGRIPLLIFGDRGDFALFVQALSKRNEPEPVPASMGACMIAGYNNWDRVSLIRDRADWTKHKELYQDRFILLSEGRYSGIPAASLGLAEEEWLRLSLVIRREHECAHYFTRRVFSSMRNNLIDELIADYAGLTAAVGEFPAAWFLHFLGVESYPVYHEGGRLQNYRGNLSAGAFTVLQQLVVRAAANVEEFHRRFRDRLQPWLAFLVLTEFTAEELACGDAPDLLAAALARRLEDQATAQSA